MFIVAAAVFVGLVVGAFSVFVVETVVLTVGDVVAIAGGSLCCCHLVVGVVVVVDFVVVVVVFVFAGEAFDAVI